MHITTIIFDLGGVLLTLEQPEAIRRFSQLGVKDAEKQLDTYTQGGIFGQLESGAISAEEFRALLSQATGRELSWEQCRWAWLGYAKSLPGRNLSLLRELRARGYRLLLLSNTNPYMMSWVESPDFDGSGHPLTHYLDRLYCSYRVGEMKPSEQIFLHVTEAEGITPGEAIFIDDGPRNVETARRLGFHTLQPRNGEDWTDRLRQMLTNP